MINEKDGNANISVEIFQGKQSDTKSLLFCLTSIPSLYAYQRLSLYFLKQVAFSTTKLVV